MKKYFHHFNQSVIPTLLIILFFLPHLAAGKIPIPADLLLGLYHPWRDKSFDGYSPQKFPAKNPLIVDPIVQTYPWKFLVINNLKSRQLPLWNPYSFSGQPLLANVQSSPLQIFNLLFFILPFKIAWATYIILPSVLSGIFMYWLLKEYKLSKTASTFGAFVLPFTGYFITWLEWGNMISTAMWLPVLLLSIKKLFSEVSPKWFILIIFALVQVLVSGFWQTAFYVFFASILFLIFTYLGKKNLKSFSLVILSFVISILLSAPQILPTLEFINLSARDLDTRYYQGRQDWFLPYQNLVGLIAPDYFGNPSTYNYWGVWNYLEFATYIGIVPLCLALLSFYRPKSESKYFILLALTSLVLALKNPISQFPYLLNIPLISTMQPSRIVFLLAFSLTALGAFGLEKFIKAKPSIKLLIWPIIIFSSLILVVGFTLIFKDSSQPFNDLNTQIISLRNLTLPILTSIALIIIFSLKIFNISKKIIVLAIFALSMFELFRFGYKFNSFSKLSWIFPQTEAINFLQNQQKPFRIMILDRRIFEGNTSSVYSLEQVGGYDPLFLKDYAKLVSSWNEGRVLEPGSFNRIIFPKNYQSQITDLLNAQFILSLDEVNDPKLVKVFEQGQTKIYKNLNSIPRAFFANEIVQVSDENAQLSLMLDKSFNLSKKAISSNLSFANQNFSSFINFEKYHDQSFSLAVSTEKQAPLIVSNVFYPGWQAFIDGQKIQIYEVNFMFQSIIVPQGNHQVEFKYRPKSFYNGLYLSTFGIILVAILSYLIWKKRFQ